MFEDKLQNALVIWWVALLFAIIISLWLLRELSKRAPAIKSIEDKLFSNDRLIVNHVVLVLIVMGLIMIGLNIFRSVGEKHAGDWLKTELKIYTSKKPDPLNLSPQFKHKTSNKRLKEQYRYVWGKARDHLMAAKYYNIRFFASISIGSITAVFAVICLFYITRKSFERSGSYLLTVFFLTSFCGTYFGAVPALFQQQRNATSNLKVYAAYKSIENQIKTFAATGLYLREPNEPIRELDVFSNLVDEKISTLTPIPIEFDKDAFKAEDIVKGLGS